MKDLVREEHHHPTKWTKTAIKGGITGALFGYAAFAGGPVGPME